MLAGRPRRPVRDTFVGDKRADVCVEGIRAGIVVQVEPERGQGLFAVRRVHLVSAKIKRAKNGLRM